jgi:hypothetical protein
MSAMESLRLLTEFVRILGGDETIAKHRVDHHLPGHPQPSEKSSES